MGVPITVDADDVSIALALLNCAWQDTDHALLMCGAETEPALAATDLGAVLRLAGSVDRVNPRPGASRADLTAATAGCRVVSTDPEGAPTADT